MAIGRTAWTDDDGSGTTGTVINNAVKTSLYDEIDAALAALPSGIDTVLSSAVTGAQNNWAPALVGNTIISWSGASAAAFTGVAGGVAGQRVTVKNTGSAVATFAHNSGSSSAGNKLFNIATSGATPIAPGGSLTYEYDGTLWQLVAHEQGAWITPTFAAGDFTGNGAQTWTLAAGDVGAMGYRLSGRTMTVSFYLQTTSVGGTPATQLLIGNGQWGGFASARAPLMGGIISVNAGAAAAASYATLAAAGTTISLYTGVVAANWGAATNTTEVYGTISFEVQ